MKTDKYDKFVEDVLSSIKEQQENPLGTAWRGIKQIGTGLAGLGNVAKAVYNTPAALARGASSLKQAVQTGEIPTQKPRTPGQQQPATAGGPGSEPRAGDEVRLRIPNVGGMQKVLTSKFENKRPYQHGGYVYDVSIPSNPNIPKMQVVYNPQKSPSQAPAYFYDKSGVQVDAKTAKLNPAYYIGRDPQPKDPKKPSWVYTGFESDLFPPNQQPQQKAPGQP